MGMNRRHFFGLAVSAAGATVLPRAFASAPLQPFALGVVIKPYGAPEEHLRTVHELGFPSVFLSMGEYLGSLTAALASQFAICWTNTGSPQRPSKS
jgi:L-ribulose-5-phosphate 3-epimerase